MSPDFADITRHFQFEGAFLRADPIAFGHINDTYAVCFQNACGLVRRYILQRINHNVFRHPEKLMHNVQGVTTHLRQKVIAAGGNPDRETLNLIPTAGGQSFYKTPSGEYWRAYVFIENAQTYEVASLQHVYQAARAFGRFQAHVSDYPLDRLYETIPDFHHTRKRFNTFVEAVDRDVENRARFVRAEIEFAEKRFCCTTVLVDLLEQGLLPKRVTHNDTKFNNVLIDSETGEGICVVDLDTVMPGLSLYDFGDSVRSAANLAAEDERDLSKVTFDLQVFDHLTHGYLDSAREFLTPLEIDYLPFSAMLITFECGMRFLTDYLSGDTYFRIHRSGHNLDRCRTQFKLVEDIERNLDCMLKIVETFR
jgi:Phosphotransferase enzyme family